MKIRQRLLWVLPPLMKQVADCVCNHLYQKAIWQGDERLTFNKSRTSLINSNQPSPSVAHFVACVFKAKFVHGVLEDRREPRLDCTPACYSPNKRVGNAMNIPTLLVPLFVANMRSCVVAFCHSSAGILATSLQSLLASGNSGMKSSRRPNFAMRARNHSGLQK